MVKCKRKVGLKSRERMGAQEVRSKTVVLLLNNKSILECGSEFIFQGLGYSSTGKPLISMCDAMGSIPSNEKRLD